MGDNKKVQQQKKSVEKKGWLYKWTNYLKGYQRRWFVLQSGHLSYYRNPAEVEHTCRGAIKLQGALINTIDTLTFYVSNGDTRAFHIKAVNEKEKQEWVRALELAKGDSTSEPAESEEEYLNNQKEDQVLLIKLNEKLKSIETWNDILKKKELDLQKTSFDLEISENLSPESKEKLIRFNQQASKFKEAAEEITKVSGQYAQLAQEQDTKWKRILKYEREQKNKIGKVVEQLARQQFYLEGAAQQALSQVSSGGSHRNSLLTNTSPSEDDEFYDAPSEPEGFTFDLHGNHAQNNLHCSDDESSSDGDDPDTPISSNYRDLKKNRASTSCSDENMSSGSRPSIQSIHDPSGESGTSTTGTKWKRRTRVPDKPNYPLNLWSIMKNCIGKELSKIPMPVNFSEPLSMLQRLTEDYEYANILDRAAECTDYLEQMAYIAAFTVSSYSTTASRTGKPFNPLLGETYECDRMDDLGWRAVSEQVSHHPPIAAQYCEGRKWRCWQEFTMASKFRGKHLQVIPLGSSHLEFNDGNCHYTWRKVTTTVHNIIVGKLWVDQSGDMEIVNHKQGIKCHLKYVPYSYFSRDSQRRVKGYVMNADKEVKYILQGTWDAQIEFAPVISTSGTPDNPTYNAGQFSLAWERNIPPRDCEKYYNFTLLACQLNEPEEGVAPTDSRLRPDQRLMEDGLWDEANLEKVRLEEQQRQRARQMYEASDDETSKALQPVWFEKQKDPYLEHVVYVYKGDYWECKKKQDWSRCPTIY